MPVKKSYYKSNTKTNKYHINKYQSNKKRKIYRKSKKIIRMKGGSNSLNLNNISNKRTFQIRHPMDSYIKKKVEDKYIIVFDKDNVEQIDYNNIYVNAFLNKLLDILNFSFTKEREYHISIGTYPQDYEYGINNIISNLINPRFMTILLTDAQLQPISMLYVEKNSDDFDKIWTVCTDKDYRGQGISSLILNYMIVKQLNEKRDKMLLEVYNDNEINRETDKDVLQKHIMKLFSSKGFGHKDVSTFSENTRNNLLHRNDNTKVMVFNPQDWLDNNSEEKRNLNLEAKKTCGC